MAPRVRWGTYGVGALFLTLNALIAIVNLGGSGNQHLHVFGTFWSSGWAATRHMNPYAAYPRSVHFYDNLYHHRTLVSLNLTPPCLLPLFQLIAAFQPENAVKVYTLVSLLLFLASMALMMIEYGERVQRRQIIWFFFGPAALGTLVGAQDYSLLLALAVLSWVLFEYQQYIAAGIFLGALVAIKPNLALWPIFLAICGHWRVAKFSALIFVVLGLLPISLYGPHIYAEWLGAISNDPHWVSFTDISLTGFASRLGHRTFGRVLSLILLLCSTVYVAWKRPSGETAIGIAVCLGLLASPLGWVGYSLFLTPVLLRRRWSTRLTLAIAPSMLPIPMAGRGLAPTHLSVTIAGLFYFVPVCFMLIYFLWSAALEARALSASEKACPRVLA